MSDSVKRIRSFDHDLLAGADLVKRVRYFERQLLTASDFVTEQEYHRRVQHTHNRLLHGWGVAEGLEVTTAAGGQEVLVEAGVAFDANGRMVVLSSDNQQTLV